MGNPTPSGSSNLNRSIALEHRAALRELGRLWEIACLDDDETEDQLLRFGERD
jgi:hypothetical protein